MVTLDDIREAARLIEGQVERTPCAHARTLSEITGADIHLKFENLQFTGSFKDRGALVKLLSLGAAERSAGVIAMSAGNHAQAVAYHARRLGIPAAIVMPRTTPNVKVEQTRLLGAEVILEGAGYDDAASVARTLAGTRGLTLVHPYDDEKVIAGQGTIALEMLQAFPDLEVLVVPIGGGGLIAGCAVAAKGLRPAVEIVGVEAARFPSMLQVIEGRPVACGSATIAEGIAVKEPGRITRAIVADRVDAILLAEEREIEEAVRLLLEIEKTIVEGAGAVGLAAVIGNRDRFRGRRVGLILSGGNIDLIVLASLIQRGLVRSGRLARVRVELPDVPGALAEVACILGEADANIVELQHHRAFTNLSLRAVEVEFVLHTRGLDHVRQILDRLGARGYAASLPDVETRARPV